MGKENTDCILSEAAKKAQIYDFIQSLPKGFDTEKELLDAVKTLDSTIVMITHRDKVVEAYGDKIITLG